MRAQVLHVAMGGALICAFACGATPEEIPGTIQGVVSCTANTDCDNGLPCDGAETCSQGVCVLGPRIVCDDGIACTTDLCSNDLGECLYLPQDDDDDGHPDDACQSSTGTPFGDDCDDGDPARFPGNAEVCDEADHDEDCDGSTFGSVDADGDGYFDARCCNDSACGSDCDDLRAQIHPGLLELCDGVDNDCDGSKDEGVTVTLYADLDGDGFGNPAAPVAACAGTPKTSTLGTDCDDDNRFRYPALVEVCDNIDNDCDGVVDDGIPITATWYADVDGDGFGNPNGPTIQTCVPTPNYSLLANDCDDSRAAVSPVAPELCDGIDNDCNGAKDFVVGLNNFEDDDDDGLLDPACVGGADCDDKNPFSGPGNVEQCDGRDNDCDTRTDEGVTQTAWFRDLDGDGYGKDSSGVVISCRSQTGYAALGGDCDDSDSSRSPSVVEDCDQIDDDCDGQADEDFAFATNPNHCGGCGNLCFGVGFTGTCSGGSCSCSAPLQNCDGNLANGCEVNTNTSQLHCGGCGQTCVLPGALSQCDSGQCEVAFCLPGRLDCTAAPGCETLESATDCGACGNVCTVGQTTCVDHTCKFACDAQRFDCDNNPQNGCETLGTSNAHCGGCNPCGAHQSCSAAFQCSCDGEYGNCDGNPQNGCEAALLNDVDNCGACGNSCRRANQHGTAGCSALACEPVVCDAGWDSCSGDGDPLTCETPLGSLQHCGACNNNCQTQSANGLPLCIQSSPGSYQCQTFCDYGYADCDNSPATCEKNLKDDTENCGACGTVCDSGQVCINGSCAVDVPSGDQGPARDTAQIAVGADHTCAIRQGGELSCWGGNDKGQLGRGTNMPALGIAVVDFGSSPVTRVWAGNMNTCVALGGGADEHLWCWGDNQFQQLGPGAPGGFAGSPHEIALGSAIASGPYAVAIGDKFICAIAISGGIFCWGNDDDEGLANGDSISSSEAPVLSLAVGSQITAGKGFACANSATDQVKCWGVHTHGNRGDGLPLGSAARGIPQALTGNAMTDRIQAGGDHACRIIDGSLSCWGRNHHFQISSSGISQPDPSSFLLTHPAVSLGTYLESNCALYENKDVVCWGSQQNKQLGTGSTSGDSSAPVAVQSTKDFVSLAHGAFAQHVCALATDEFVYCWGDNANGQINGNPNVPVDQITPIQIFDTREAQ